MSNQLAGLVIKNQSGFYHVETTDGTVYVCRLRGRLKEEAKSSDIAAIGDRVFISPNEQDDGLDEHRATIEKVEERHSVLSRAVRTTGKRGTGQAEREHILIANPDQALFAFSAAQPTPNWKLLDRLLVTAESNYLDDIIIVINKIDLVAPGELDKSLEPYRKIGYEILFTSVMTGEGIAELKTRLEGKISVLTGPSGVGKTSLLNEIQPDLGRVVSSISEYSQEGMHTTRDSALIKLAAGGYLADTPGIRQMAIWDVEPDELDAYFPDIREHVTTCKYRNCTHTREPGCAVLEAVSKGELSRRRYENFIELRGELKETYIVY